MSKCPIQRALNRLRLFAGLPVPNAVLWRDGKPDFRATDPEKFLYHFKHRLCAVCGTKLGMSCYWIGGGRSAVSHYFTDGPMHQLCAEVSISHCPFLNGQRLHFRGDDIQGIPEQNNESRPERMFLLRGDTSALTLHQIGPESIVLYAGQRLTSVKEF